VPFSAKQAKFLKLAMQHVKEAAQYANLNRKFAAKGIPRNIHPKAPLLRKAASYAGRGVGTAERAAKTKEGRITLGAIGALGAAGAYTAHKQAQRRKRIRTPDMRRPDVGH
jgi:hypothetical protein